MCYDDKPPLGLNSVRDSFAIFRDDAVSLKIDPALDGRTTLGFVTNPTGAMLDYRGINEKQFWGSLTPVDGRSSTSIEGWSAEFRIPWSSLGINPARPPETIGFNVSRDHPRLNATYDWALMSPPFSPISASRYGRINGFAPLKEETGGDEQRVGLSRSILGYVTGGFRRNPNENAIDTDGVYNGGIDASLSLGQKFSARITVTPTLLRWMLMTSSSILTASDCFSPKSVNSF